MLLLFVVKDAFTIVDELHGLSPPLKKDYFFDTVDVDIPYTVSAEKHRASRLLGSAAKVYVVFSYLSRPTGL